MKSNFEVWANNDIRTYYNWLKNKTKNNTDYNYSICAAVDEFSPYDLVQFKTDSDGDADYSFIELKGRNIGINEFEDCAVESYKIKNILRISSTAGKEAYIVAIYYKSSKLSIWKLDPEANYISESMFCQWHTADGTGQKKMKEMVKLPLSDAKIYNFNNISVLSDCK